MPFAEPGLLQLPANVDTMAVAESMRRIQLLPDNIYIPHIIDTNRRKYSPSTDAGLVFHTIIRHNDCIPSDNGNTPRSIETGVRPVAVGGTRNTTCTGQSRHHGGGIVDTANAVVI